MNTNLIRVDAVMNLNPETAKELEDFLDSTGRKRGPFVKSLVIKALSDWKDKSKEVRK